MSNLVTKTRLQYLINKLWSSKIKPIKTQLDSHNHDKVYIKKQYRTAYITDYCTVSNGEIRGQDAKVQQAINENDIIIIPKVDVVITTKILLPNNKTISGMRRSSFAFEGSGQIEMTGNTIIENLAFFTSSVRECLLIKSAINVFIDNCDFYNSTIQGLNTGDNHIFISIRNCNFTTNNTSSLTKYMIDFLSKDIANLIITGNRTDIRIGFINISKYCQRFNISDNIIAGAPGVTVVTNVNYINIFDSFQGILSNNIIRLINTSKNVFNIERCRDITISSNNFKENAANDIIKLLNCNNTNIVGNSINSIDYNISPMGGIIVRGSNAISIKDNLVQNCKGMGIQVADDDSKVTSKNVSIVGNMCYYNNTGNNNWVPQIHVSFTSSASILSNDAYRKAGTNSQPDMSIADCNDIFATSNKLSNYIDHGRNTDSFIASNKISVNYSQQPLNMEVSTLEEL